MLGPDRAELIMSAISLHDLDEVATKGDLAVLRAELEARMFGLEAKVDSGFSGLRAEFSSALATESSVLRKAFSTWMLAFIVIVVGAMVGVGLLT